MNISLRNPTGRNTKACLITVNNDEYFFSYETCIAFRGLRDGHYIRIRRSNEWGPTTGRHFKEMGCSAFQELDEDIFDQIITSELTPHGICVPNE